MNKTFLNAYDSKIEIGMGGVLHTFRSAESAYQAFKNPAEFHSFTKLLPSEALNKGRAMALRKDWDEIKDEVMLFVLKIKFEDLNLREMLMNEEDEIMQSFTKRSYHNSTKSEDKFLRAFKVRNEKTDEAFDRYCKANPRAGGNRRILFHGTVKRNLYSIVENGLIIQKVCANGRAFGNGLYFAEQPEKSIGYTSVGSARWTNGNEDKSVLLLYEVALGKMDVVRSVDSTLSGREMKRLGCDSVFAKGKCEDGQAVFENNEFIIYDKDACTVRYMSEQSRYAMNYAIPFNERMKMRFDADGIDLKMDGNEIIFRIEEMPKETEKIMRAYFGDDLDGISFCLDTESGMLSAENGNKAVNPRINGADMRWISRQLKREYAESEAKWKEFVAREAQKSKSSKKKGAER